MDEGAEERSNDKSNFSGRIVSAPSRGHGFDQTHKTDNIEKRIDYLRTQHAETLTNLHGEIERLKAENKGEQKKKNNSDVYADQFSLHWIDKKSRSILEKYFHVEDFTVKKYPRLSFLT